MLSIIIPVYNVEQYIEACLDSILTQNLNDFEIICINDGSTDNSLGILEKYQNKERRLKIYSQKNSGPGVARNFAINIAKGDYICFVDPDDKLEPLSLDSVYQFAIEKKLKVVQFNYKTFQENKDYKEYNFAEQILNLYNYDLNKIKYYNFNNVLKDCFHAFDMHIVNKIYSRDFIIKNKIYFTNDRYAEDWLFAIKVLIKADRIYYFDKCIYNYRLREGSLCNSKHKNVLDIFNVFNAVEEFLNEENKRISLLEQFNNYKYQIIIWAYDSVPKILFLRFHFNCFKALNIVLYLKFLKYIFKRELKNLFNKNQYSNNKKHKIITILGTKIKIKV